MLPVYEINNIGQLGVYRNRWRTLLESTPRANFFQSLSWLECYWKHHGEGQTLRVLIVGDREKPTGIVPLVIRKEARKIGDVRVLTYPLDDWGSFFGPISRLPKETLEAALHHIATTPKSWDLLELRWLREEQHDAAQTAAAMKLAHLPGRKSLRMETSLIELSGTWEGYLASRTSKWRNNHKRWQRRLAEAGEVAVERYRPGGACKGETDPRWDLYEECERIAAISWQGASTDGTTLSHESTKAFLRDVHQFAAADGCLDLNLLRVDGRAIAFAYNYVFGKEVFGLRVGYDPEFVKVSPGNILYAMTIEDSFARGDCLYDLGPGSLNIKRYFHSHIEPVLQQTYYRPTAINAQILKLKASLGDWWTSTEEATESAGPMIKV